MLSISKIRSSPPPAPRCPDCGGTGNTEHLRDRCDGCHIAAREARFARQARQLADPQWHLDAARKMVGARDWEAARDYCIEAARIFAKRLRAEEARR